MPHERHPLLSEFPVAVHLTVQWGDMDAYGHANNTLFFRFFESARIRYLERCGFIATYETQKIGAILHSTECRFRRPLFYPDEVLVGGRALDVGADRFTMGYRVVSLTHDVIAADGSGIIVSYDYTAGSKTTLPSAVREAIMRLERSPDT